MISAHLKIDLSHRGCDHRRVGNYDGLADESHHDKHLICALDQLPDGAHVIVDIADRTFVSDDVVYWLSRNDARLTIEVHGSQVDAVASIVQRARAGKAWQVVA